MKRAAILGGLLWLGTASAALAQNQDEGFGISVDAWLADIEGTIQGDAAGSPGTKIDLDDSLGIDDFDDGVGALDAWIAIPTAPIKVRFYSFGGRADDTVTLSSPITFGGRTFSGGATVEGEVILRRYVLAADWVPPQLLRKVTDVEIGVILGLHYVSHTLRLTEGSAEVGRNVRALSAYTGGRVTWTLYNQFQIEGLVAWTPEIELMDREYDSFDISVEFRYIFSDNFVVGGGYRFLTIEGEDAENSPSVDRIDVDVQGFFLRAMLMF